MRTRDELAHGGLIDWKRQKGCCMPSLCKIARRTTTVEMTSDRRKTTTLYVANMPDAPNPRRVLMFMAELGLKWSDVDIVQLNMLKGEHKTAKNPTGKLPFLELPNGTVIAESMAICRYLYEAHPSLAQRAPLYGKNAAESGVIEMWLRRLELEFLMQGVGPAWVNGPVVAKMFKIKQNEKAHRHGVRLARSFLWDVLDRALVKQKFVAGDDFTVADVSAYCLVEFATTLVQMQLDTSLENVHRWLAEMRSRKSATSHREVFRKSDSKL